MPQWRKKNHAKASNWHKDFLDSRHWAFIISSATHGRWYSRTHLIDNVIAEPDNTTVALITTWQWGARFIHNSTKQLS